MSELPAVHRAFHAKVQAGITNAEFRIDPNIPQYLQNGIFQPGKTYSAHVRLSNASGLIQSDIKNDLRGLAARIYSTNEHGEKRFNDLLMTNAPVSHARNAYQFMAFAKAASSSPTWLMPLRLMLAVGIGETIRILLNLSHYSARKVASLATETYWSRGPFQLAQAAVHFHCKPAEGTLTVPTDKSTALKDNYLRDELVERLKSGAITFDFMVQLFVSEEKTPIEDGAIQWKESDSPPIRIAQLILPQQDLGRSDAYDAQAIIEQTGFNPWNGAEVFRPLGQLMRSRKTVYAASEDFRLKRKVEVPPQPIFISFMEGIFAVANRFVRWDKLPPLLGALSLAQIRAEERQKNLHDTETDVSQASALPRRCPIMYLTNRSPDGSYNDLSDPDMGRTGRRFGRNLPLNLVQQPSDERILTPNPRTVAREFMTREHFQPATTLNLLAAAWIQFMIHDWVAHSTTGNVPPFEIEIDENDDWPKEHSPMKVRRTKVDPIALNNPDAHIPVYLNQQSPWWDGGQIYGVNEEIQHKVGSHNDGKLYVDEQGLLGKVAGNDADKGDGVEVTGVNNNWWIGLGLMHTLFTLEHNAICNHLKTEYPTWNDEQLFHKARLINTALIAKIHTVEWTPAILGHPTLQTSMNANWWGLAGESIKKIFGRISPSEVISGIPGSATDHFGVPYSLTEEFVSVYRMHQLLPDWFVFRSAETDELIDEKSLEDAVGSKVREIMEQIEVSNLFYSFGIANPGAITLKNYPNFLRRNLRRDSRLVDLAAVEILRDRERGVARYNDFRRMLRLAPVQSFGQLTPNIELAKKIESVYDGKIEDVDLQVGLLAEEPPKGFGFSDTAFRIFILTASRRLNSDRFFTIDYTPQVYTQTGLDWVANNTMINVLLRHYPKLEPVLRQSKNAFAPWDRIAA